MSRPATDTYDRLKKFMDRDHDGRFESLFLQSQRFKSILESEGIVKTMREWEEIMNGNGESAGLLVRMKWQEEKTKQLIKSNANLQKAIYIGTGVVLAAKFYFEYIAPHKP